MIDHDNQKEDSFVKKYAVKVVSSIFNVFLSIVVGSIVPRALGSRDYGNYSFLTNIFSQIINFLDMRASTCLYVKVSQNPKDLHLIRFYNLYCVLIVFCMLIGTLYITSNSILLDHLLPAQQIRYVYLALIFTVTLFSQQQLAKLMDAFGLTIYSEKTNLFLRAVNVALVLVFFQFKMLDLSLYFYMTIATNLIFVVVVLFILKKISFSPILSLVDINQYSKVYYRFCAPLSVYILVSFISEYFDRWILQKYGGSVQQGFYAFALGLSGMSMLAVSSIYLLFTREVSVAVGRNDLETVAKLFDSYVPILYAIVSFFTCFVFVQSASMINIFGGKGYGGATLVLRILSVFPLFATFSMMSGAIIYATERTTILRNISFVSAPLGILLSALLISPIVGANFGAAGLGVKLVIVEFIGVVVTLFLNSRHLKISFKKYFLYLLYIPSIFLVCAGLASLFADLSVLDCGSVVGNTLISGAVYSIISILLIYIYPSLIFRERHELIWFIRRLRHKFMIAGGVS